MMVQGQQGKAERMEESEEQQHICGASEAVRRRQQWFMKQTATRYYQCNIPLPGNPTYYSITSQQSSRQGSGFSLIQANHRGTANTAPRNKLRLQPSYLFKPSQMEDLPGKMLRRQQVTTHPRSEARPS